MKFVLGQVSEMSAWNCSLIFLIRIHFTYGRLLTHDVRDMVETTSFVAWMTGRHADTTNFEEVPFKCEDDYDLNEKNVSVFEHTLRTRGRSKRTN